jgi:hypothetical protein
MSEENLPPSNSDLFFKISLYSSVNLSHLDDQERKEYIFSIVSPNEGFDFYCLECERDSYFTLTSQPELMAWGQKEFQKIWNRKRDLLGQIEKLEPSNVKGPQRTLNPEEQKSLLSLKTALRRAEQDENKLPLDVFLFSVELSCTRDANHIMCFVFRVQNDKLTKIGQTPSIADLNNPQIKKYRKLLDDQFKGACLRLGGGGKREERVKVIIHPG